MTLNTDSASDAIRKLTGSLVLVTSQSGVVASLIEAPIEVHKVHWMSDVVSGAVNGFLISFAEAVGIVLVVLTLFMGWRISLVIGIILRSSHDKTPDANSAIENGYDPILFEVENLHSGYFGES